jgi:hypothetical protein
LFIENVRSKNIFVLVNLNLPSTINLSNDEEFCLSYGSYFDDDDNVAIQNKENKQSFKIGAFSIKILFCHFILSFLKCKK